VAGSARGVSCCIPARGGARRCRCGVAARRREVIIGMAVWPDRVLVSLFKHCLCRAFFIQRTILQCVSFDEMLVRLSPVAAREKVPVRIPEGLVFRTADLCAYLLPWLWRRRCLFRSLLVLDWARRLGIDPTLNVGMELGLRQDQGHCWLSIGGRAFCEPGGWPTRYGTLFHRGGSLQHWTSLAPDARSEPPVRT